MYFNSEMIDLFNKSVILAKENQHQYLTIEHFMKYFFNSEVGEKMLDGTNLNLETLNKELDNYLEHIEKINSNTEIIKTESFEDSLQSSMDQSVNQGKQQITIYDYIPIALSKKTHISKIFKKHNINIEELVKREPVPAIKERNPELEKVSEELVSKAKAGELNRAIGVDDKIDLIFQTLKRKSKANVVLIGEAGVGKTAIVEELAHLINNGEVPDFLQKNEIHSLNIGAVLSGTKYRGEFEGKLKSLMDELQKSDKNILFIDEIHTIMGAGSSSDSNVDIANLIKPYLSSGKIKVIGATTNEEYRQSFVKDKAISRRFTPLKVLEPTLEDCKTIVLANRNLFESHHKVSYDIEALSKAVEYSDRYITNRFLPDKAIDIIDISGSKVHLQGGKKVTTDDIVETIENLTKIKISDVNKDKNEKKKIKDLAKNIKSEVFGQEEVIDEISKKIAKQRIFKTKKPISVLMSGATGTGKTEIAKQIQDKLSMNFIRLDMSNFSEKQDVSNLTGSAAGLVGFEEGSPFLKDVQTNPYSVILLDEIEKANPEIFNMFLAIFDEGKIDDNKGETVDFTNTIIIMTTNLGYGKSKMVSNKISLGVSEDTQSLEKTNIIENVKSFFRPEFINRLDLITVTNKLDKTVIIDIVKKELKIANKELVDIDIDLKVTKRALEFFAEEGYSEEYGARNIKRVIDKYIKEKLTDLYIEGDIKNQATLKVGYSKDKVTYEVVN